MRLDFDVEGTEMSGTQSDGRGRHGRIELHAVKVATFSTDDRSYEYLGRLVAR